MLDLPNLDIVTRYICLPNPGAVSLSNIIDVYYLAALEWETKAPEKRAQEKLAEDVRETNAFLLPRVARALRDYLLAASCGEARHALQFDAIHCPAIPMARRRGAGMVYMYDYDPASTLDTLEEIYSYAWRGKDGGYGGSKWRAIVRLTRSYFTLAPLVFIDQAVNAYHNGGLAFDKLDAFFMAQMTMNGKEFSSFVESKAVDDVLSRDCIWRWNNLLAEPVRRLLKRFYVSFKNSSDMDGLPTSSKRTWPSEYVPKDYGTAPMPPLRLAEAQLLKGYRYVMREKYYEQEAQKKQEAYTHD